MKFILLAVLLLGCAEDPIETKKTNNPGIEVGLLFEHEGCRVYRFYDYLERHYFVRCKSGEQQVFDRRTENCGKNCQHDVIEEVPTLEVKP